MNTRVKILLAAGLTAATLGLPTSSASALPMLSAGAAQAAPQQTPEKVYYRCGYYGCRYRYSRYRYYRPYRYYGYGYRRPYIGLGGFGIGL